MGAMDAAEDGDARYLYGKYSLVQLTESVAMAYVVPVAAT